jgi:hypothetical protein
MDLPVKTVSYPRKEVGKSIIIRTRYKSVKSRLPDFLYVKQEARA